MRIVVIGGTGHVGTYLVPRLVMAGHEVIVVTRGQRSPYQPHGAWKFVRTLTTDRTAEEAAGRFGSTIAALGADVVIDLICFTPHSARLLVDALRGRVGHLLHCGTIWVHGPSVCVPTTEEAPRRAFGEYGIRKMEIEAHLLQEALTAGLPVTILHPGHIVGPGWEPLNPAGHFNLQAFEQLARGEELTLPNIGMETVHHVHADDVAQAFERAITHRSTAVAESFHVVSSRALTLRGYAESVARWFGREAHLRFLPWEEWKATVSEREAAITWDHIAHSPNCSIAKAARLLEYQPRFTSLEGVFEALSWLIREGRLKPT